MEEEDSDTFIRELYASSEEELPISDDQAIERTREIGEIRKEVFESFPEIPDDYIEGIPELFYYATQFIIAYTKLDGENPGYDPYTDSDEIVREKATIDYFCEAFTKLVKVIEIVGDKVYNSVYDNLEVHVGGDTSHPLIFFLEAIERHKELHCRHLKTDPGVARARSDPVKPTYNAVTGERYDFDNPNHKSWRSLIINPLPSDYNHNNLDPEEGGKEYQILIELEKEQGTYKVAEPFSIVVTREWENIFRCVHSLIHFQDYMFTKMLSCISSDKDWEIITSLSTHDTWKYLLTEEYYNVPIAKLSGGKKKLPAMVAALIEMREMLKRVVSFVQ